MIGKVVMRSKAQMHVDRSDGKYDFYTGLFCITCRDACASNNRFVRGDASICCLRDPDDCSSHICEYHAGGGRDPRWRQNVPDLWQPVAPGPVLLGQLPR